MRRVSESDPRPQWGGGFRIEKDQDLAWVYLADGEQRLTPHRMSQPPNGHFFKPKERDDPFTIPLALLIPPPTLAAICRMVHAQ